jgi:hypothetical protein
MDIENLALWFGGEADYSGQIADGYITEIFTVKRGRYYQLGLTQEPYGARHIEPDYTFETHPAGTSIDIGSNLTLDRTEGRFYVLPDAADLADGSQIEVTFQYRTSHSRSIKEPGNTISGSLRFISRSDNGKSYFFPFVKLEPSGSMDLKGDQWQQSVFTVEILKLKPSVEYFYALDPSLPEYTSDEQAIIDLSGVTLDEFPYWDDQLDEIVNIFLPAADLGQVITYP